MSKLDELIEWHEKHATYYTDSAVLQQTHRDTAEALRLCRDVLEGIERLKIDEHIGDEKFDTALAALRDSGMIDPPKPASGREQGQRGGE